MKSFPVALFFVALTISSTSCDPRAFARSSADPEPVPVARPAPLYIPGRAIWDMFPSFSDWVSSFFPDAGRIFSMTKNLLAGTPARLVTFSLNQVCSIASKVGLLKQNYVPDAEKLQLQLHRHNNVVFVPLKRASIILGSEYFDSNKNVTVFITGWESASNSKDSNHPVNVLIQSYLKRESENFILFDAARFVENLYHWATLNEVYIGGELGNALVTLISRIPANRIHVIGHSIGAHIAGIAGRRVHSSTGQQLGRITGLDPALPCVDRQVSLQKGDANFVDVIHTSSGALGQKKAIGDVDFYPNGAVPLPPGCFDVVCSHNRAVAYFAETLAPSSADNFLAVRCASVSEFNQKNCHGKKISMGFATPSNVRGIYYLETNAKSPYGQNSA